MAMEANSISVLSDYLDVVWCMPNAVQLDMQNLVNHQVQRSSKGSAPMTPTHQHIKNVHGFTTSAAPVRNRRCSRSQSAPPARALQAGSESA